MLKIDIHTWLGNLVTSILGFPMNLAKIFNPRKTSVFNRQEINAGENELFSTTLRAHSVKSNAESNSF